jgi:hypothetical protein
MLPTDNSPSLDRVKDLLQPVLEHVNPMTQFAIESDFISISIEDWQMRIWANSDPSVLIESQEIAAAHLEPEDPNQSTLLTYGFRLEISCDLDPNLDRFNYYIHVLEALETLPGAIIFNPSTAGFIE